MKDKIVSIIIPIYNCEKYLCACLDSIINQSYESLEILLIDDGSTDNSRKICEKYMKNDKRIKLISQKNSGCAAARNAGLDSMTGDYVLFVDSDDVINQNMVKIMQKKLEENNADVVVCNFSEFDSEEEIINIKSDNDYTKVYNNYEAVNLLNCTDDITLALWAKLYKKEIFNNRRLPLIKTSEDNLITYEIFVNSNKIVLIDDILYFNRNRLGSLTRDNSYVDMNLLYEGIKITNYIKETMPEEYFNCIYKYIKLSIGIYNKMINRNVYDKEGINTIQKQVSEWYKIIEKNIKIDFMHKIEIKFFIRNLKIYRVIYKFYKRKNS